MKIGEIFKSDISRDINPVIKVADRSEEQLREELDSYVVTEVIERYLEDFLNHYAETRLKETDHIGAWLYGFVGAGKSHLAKIVGLLLANPKVAGQNAIDRFIPRIQTCKRSKEIERLLFEIRNNMVTEVIPFHINSEANQAAEDNICKIFYRVFFRHLGFSEDIRIAFIEQALVRSGKYEVFKSNVNRKTGEEWETLRRPDYWDLYRQEIFSALTETLPSSYSSTEDAQKAFEGKQLLVTFHNFAERVEEYVTELDKKNKGKTHRVLFIVDELGAFIADSGRKLHDVGTLTEDFAKVGKGHIWIFATGHDSLKDLVDNAREFQVDFKWLEGRFKKQYTLTAENIEVVLEERLFKKSAKGETELKILYQQKPGAISELGGLSKISRTFPDLNEERFISCYPFRPYQLILAPEILHSIRTAGGRSDVLAGATRSLLGITQGVLAREENGYKQAEIGKVVPFDQIYSELQDVEIPHQIRAEISGVDQRIPKQEFPLKRLLQTLFLVQQLDYIPTSPRNLSLLMADHIDIDLKTLESQVIKGLEQLQTAAYVVESGGLYKYISGEERDDAELIAQKKAEVKTIHRREKLKDQFLTSHILPIGVVQYEDKFQFDIRVICDGRFNDQGEYTAGQVIHSKGNLELRIFSCLSATLNDTSIDNLEEKSLSEPHMVYWLSNKSSKIEGLLTSLIGTENAMGPIESDTTQSAERRKRARRYLDELETHIKPQIEEEIPRCLREGHIVFQGTTHSIAAAGDHLNAIFNREMSSVIPKVYTQFSRAKYKIVNERKTIEDILTESSQKLKSVGESSSQPPGLGLFDNQGNLKVTTPAVSDIYDYLDKATQKGERTNGDTLCTKFSSIPYGWDPNLIRVITAATFRSNFLVIKYENATYRDYRVEEARKAFIDSRKFNRAELTLETETPPSPADLQRAREEVELIFGIKPQETPSSIAEILEKKINELVDEHRHLKAWVEGSQFPVSETFIKAPDTLNEIVNIKRPNTIVKKFLENLEGVRESVAIINNLAKFYDSPDRKKFNDMVKLLPIGRFLRDRISKTEMPNTIEGTDFLEKRWTEKNLLERFSEAFSLLLQAIPELQKKFDDLKKKCIEAIAKAIERLLSFGRQEGLGEGDFKECLNPLQNKKETIEKAYFELTNEEVTIQSLWTGVSEIEAIEDRIRQDIEALAIKKKGKKPPEEKPRKRIRLREIPDVPKVIRDEGDLSKTLTGIDKAVKDALKDNQEVELD
jgi:hypothetical protein